MEIDDLIYYEHGIYFKYSNLIKNSNKRDPWKNFFVKQYDSDGEFSGQYIEVNKSIFRIKEILPYTRKFNPEKLI